MLQRFGYQPSIRQKITLGYYAIGLIIIGLCVFIYIDLKFVGRQIMFGEAISEFFNTTLEIRRFEKNYFLYRQPSDYKENVTYVATVRQLLESNLAEFETIARPGEIMTLRKKLKAYNEYMDQYAGLHESEVTRKLFLEGMIRKTGKEITTIAEGMSKTERKHLQIMLSKSQRTLVFSIITLSLFGIAVCHALSLRVVRPLKLIEDSMGVIAGGRFENLQIDSKDREIVSLTDAFNKMLKELELRQRHLIRSEKLASLGTLLSGVAHELNNPLSNISSSCQILTEELETDDLEYKKELLSQIDDQTDRARNIVRSLLEFSRDKEFTREMLPLGKLFEETIRFIKGQIPTKVEVNIDVPEGISVFADKQRIQQAFLNLAKNALESISDEGVLTIRARKHRAIEKTDEGGA